MNRTFSIWIKIFIFRILVALNSYSFVHPDEIWQFHEPAHMVVFGRGYFTWDWRARIRSYVFPLPLIGAFYMAKAFGHFGFHKIEDFIVEAAPVLLVALWSSITDLYTYKLTRKYFSPAAGKWALLFSLSNPFQAEVGTRTFSNSVETALSALTIYLWPRNRWEFSRKRWATALLVLGINCLIRISAVQMFFFAALLVFLYAPSALEVIVIAVLMISSVLLFGTAVDSFFYGQLTASWWNFFEWNLMKNVSSYFGVEPYYFYLKTLKNEMLTGSTLPFTILGVALAFIKWKSIYLFVFFALPYFIFSSTVPHKEHRFLLPMLPILVAYSAHAGQQIEVWLFKRPNKLLKYSAVALLAAMVAHNSWLILQRAAFRGAGPGNAIRDLRNRVKSGTTDVNPESKGILVLTGCHQLPYYGVFHLDYPMTFVPCTPRFAHRFFESDPDHRESFDLSLYFGSNMFLEALDYFTIKMNQKLPSYVVIFGYHYLERVDEFKARGFESCGRHVTFLNDVVERRDSSFNDVFILCAKK